MEFYHMAKYLINRFPNKYSEKIKQTIIDYINNNQTKKEQENFLDIDSLQYIFERITF
jgi:hypothetical protein